VKIQLRRAAEDKPIPGVLAQAAKLRLKRPLPLDLTGFDWI
jgi:hypothetical protein